jgi:Uma2 family endonuclease
MQATVRTSHFITDDELIRIGEDNPGWHVERIDGGVVLCPTSWGTGPINAELISALVVWGKAHGYIALDSSTGVRMPNNDILVPDGSLMRREPYDAASDRELRAFAPVPELVVELASPSDHRPDLQAKCRRYLMHGVQFVVMIDPEAGIVETWGTPLPGLDIDWSAFAGRV